jgi:hypothetical protein
LKVAGIVKEVGQSLVAHWLTLSILAGTSLALPYWGRVTDRWSWPFAAVVFVLVLGAGFSIYRAWPIRRYAKSAELAIRVHADARQPSRISGTNIGRWFALATRGLVQGQEGNVVQEVTFQTFLFVTFDPWILVGSLEVNGLNMNLPKYQVPKLESDAMILIFEGDLPAGDLQIKIA